jgi:hypothetical protein
MIIVLIGSSIMLFLQTILIYDIHVNVIFTSQMIVEPALINDSPFYWVLKKEKERKRKKWRGLVSIASPSHPLDLKVLNIDKCYPLYQLWIVQFFLARAVRLKLCLE